MIYNSPVSVLQSPREIFNRQYNSLMDHLPSNIRYFLKRYESRMTGKNQAALEAIRQGVQRFNKERREDKQMRNINIFAYEDQKGVENELLYVVRIRGRRNSYYHNRIVKCYMLVFDSYPQEPPEVIVGNVRDPNGELEKRFMHLNVSEGGQFCMKSNQKTEEYFEYTSLADILVELEDALYNPNITSSYNNHLYSVYDPKGPNQQYYKLLNAQAKQLEQSLSDSDSAEEEP